MVISSECKNSKNANRLGTPTGNGSRITAGNSFVFKHSTDALGKSRGSYSLESRVLLDKNSN
jgi:hypothetical protein